MKGKVELHPAQAWITATLAPDMSLAEAIEFLQDFQAAVESFGNQPFVLLNHARDKSFACLEAQRAMSLGLRAVLSGTQVQRVAVYRPQGDFPTGSDDPTKLQGFVHLPSAVDWLLAAACTLQSPTP